MMCGKSPLAELILEIIKSNNSLSFLKEFGKGDNFIFGKISFGHIFLGVYFNLEFQNRSLFSIRLKFAIFISL